MTEHVVKASDGARLHVFEYGNGPPLIALHGIPEDHTSFEQILGVLAPRTRVLAPDLRGFGCSIPSPSSVDFQLLTRDLEAVVGALSLERPILLGHDAGGYVAMEYATRHPGRVRALALLNTTYRKVILRGSPQMALFGLPWLGPLVIRALGARLADLAFRWGGHAADEARVRRMRQLTGRPETLRAIAELYSAKGTRNNKVTSLGVGLT